MLLTELILSKRGPLAKVWLSAHHERKLSKQQALGVDVEESVGESAETDISVQVLLDQLLTFQTPSSPRTRDLSPFACPVNSCSV